MNMRERTEQADLIFTRAKARSDAARGDYARALNLYRTRFVLMCVAWLACSIVAYASFPVPAVFLLLSAIVLSLLVKDNADDMDMRSYQAGYMEGQYKEIRVWNTALHRALSSDRERGTGDSDTH